MISVVIPCFNEEQVLPRLYSRLSAVAAEWDDAWEVLLVDDGSRDATWQTILHLHDRDPRWKGIRLARNFGHQAALGAGLRYARGDAVVILDADLQDPPEQIVRFLGKWHEGYEVVYGVRQERPEGWLKRTCYAGFYRLLAAASEVPVPRDAGDFCLMDRRVVRALRSFPERHPFWRGLRCWSGFRQVGVPYVRHGREAGVSQYSFRKLLKLALDGFFSLSHVPLRLPYWGAAVAVFGTLVCGGALLLGAKTPTSFFLWASLALGCLQLVSLGIAGQYLGRILDEARRRPRWVIATMIGLKPARSPQRPRARRLELDAPRS